MKKRLTRIGKVIIAEVYQVININGRDHELLIDKRIFNNFAGGVLGIEPNQKHYDLGNDWCDALIELHLKNTRHQ